MSPKTFLVALSLAAVASSATANPKENASAPTAAAAPAKAERRYCMKVAPMTGSRLTSTECKTKKEWSREGVDVDKAAKS